MTTPDQPSYRAVAGERPCGDPACVCAGSQAPVLATVDRTAYERRIFDAGVAEGLKREWAVRDRDGEIYAEADEGSAQALAARWDGDGTVVSRLVGPWEPTEQDGGH